MVAVVGDIHGCFFTLLNLIEKLEKDYSKTEIYLVGDLVDRGKHSCEVIDFVKEKRLKFTPGNHEYMFYHYFNNPHSLFAEAWFSNGAEYTLKSYENRFERINEHLQLISEAPLFYNLKDCFISHAGISSYYNDILTADILSDDKKLDEIIRKDIAEPYSIVWSRDVLMNVGKLQVVGHTRMYEPKFIKANNVLYIDTAAISGNKLSAAIIEDNKIIEIISVPTVSADLY
jgi:serine/threonine protein phosphatase 1